MLGSAPVFRRLGAVSLRLGALLTDARLLAALALLSVAVVSAYLRAYPFPMSRQFSFGPESFTASVMLASGRGYVQPASNRDAGLEPFLADQVAQFDPAQLPQALPTLPPNGFQTSHRYLFWAVAGIWRLFGISWGALKVLAAVFFCAAALLAYGVFRLGMSRWLAFAATLVFMCCPVVLHGTPYLRDFSKVPFFLATLLLAGRLLQRPRATRTFLLYAALLGLTQGLGTGFRLDVIAYAAASVPVLLFCPLPAAGRWRGTARRIVALALFLAAFRVASLPLGDDSGGEHATFHHTNIGLATECLDNMGIGRASYEFMPKVCDKLVVATAQSYAWRTLGYHGDTGYMSALSDWAKRGYLLGIARTFPADMFTRACTAGAASLGVAGRDLVSDEPPSGPLAPLYAHFGRWGVVYTAAALMLVLAVNARVGVLLLFLTAYFCCSTCIQFQTRHVFHLVIIPLWCAGFLVARLAELPVMGRSASAREGQMGDLGTHRPWHGTVPARMLLAAFAAVLLFAAALGATRWWQHRNVEKILAACSSAALEPVAVRRKEWGGCVLFQPRNLFSLRAVGTATADPDATDYLVLRLASSTKSRSFIAKWQSDNFSNDYSQVFQIGPSGVDDGGEVQFFFPVHQEAPESLCDWIQFDGIAFASSDETAFRGLYRVTDLTPFPLLLWLTAPGDRRFFRGCQQFPATWFGGAAPVPRPPEMPEHPERFTFYKAMDNMRGNDVGDALAPIQDAVGAAPQEPAYAMKLAIVLTIAGDLRGALDAFHRAFALGVTDFPPIYAAFEELLGQFPASRRAEEWEKVLRQYPDVVHPYRYLKWALLDAGRAGDAAAVSQRASQVWPNFEERLGARPFNSKAADQILLLTLLDLLLRML